MSKGKVHGILHKVFINSRKTNIIKSNPSSTGVTRICVGYYSTWAAEKTEAERWKGYICEPKHAERKLCYSKPEPKEMPANPREETVFSRAESFPFLEMLGGYYPSQSLGTETCSLSEVWIFSFLFSLCFCLFFSWQGWAWRHRVSWNSCFSLLCFSSPRTINKRLWLKTVFAHTLNVNPLCLLCYRKSCNSRHSV